MLVQKWKPLPSLGSCTHSARSSDVPPLARVVVEASERPLMGQLLGETPSSPMSEASASMMMMKVTVSVSEGESAVVVGKSVSVGRSES